jgi:putative ABC transport system permease protein
MLGRTFVASEEEKGHERVVILSHGIWQRRYGGDSSIVGRTITMDAQQFTVVGVMPPRFNFPDRGDVWTPFVVDRSDQRGNRGYAGAIGRLAPGVTMQQAIADLRVVSLRLQQEFHDANLGWEAELVPLRDDLVGDLRKPFLIFLAAVGLVLLIACTNVANLTLARGATRHRELAVRVALGAGRGRLIRQLLTESLLVAAIGGAIGSGLSVFGVRLLARSFPTGVPFYISLNFDGRALTFAIVVSALTGVIFGLPPALRATHVDLNVGLRDGSQGSGDASSRQRLRSLLIVTEIAVSLVLMIGAGLLIRSYRAYEGTKLGFDEHGVVTGRVSLPFSKYQDPARREAFFQELLGRLGALTGVTAVGSSQGIPFSGWDVQGGMEAEGKPPLPPGQELISHYMWVTPAYFQAIGVPLVRGRMLAPTDRDTVAPVGVVNETFAKQFFPNEDPIGRRVRGGSRDPWVTIVGVIRDFRHYRLPQPMGPAIYYPYATRPLLSQTIAIRTSASDPITLVPALRQAVHALDADVPLYDVKTLEQQVSRSLWRQRLQASALGVFAVLAVVLTVIGIYGVIAYTVAQRTRELGVRLALGARREQVLMMILLQASRLAVVGVAIGLAAALVLARVEATLLYGVEAFDPLTFGLVPLLVIVVTIAASFGPARRATAVDPLLAMKAE